MSFFCPWQDGTQEICMRTGNTQCTPGKPGCVLFGKVVFASDDPPIPPKRKRRTKSSGDAEQTNAPE